MSRRAAARRYARSANPWRSNGLSVLEREGSREPVGHGGHRASKLMPPYRAFLEAAQGREIGRHASGPGCDRLSAELRGRSRHLDDEPLLSPDRRHGQKKTACRTRAGSPGHKSPPQTMANLSGAHRPQAAGLHRCETWTRTNMTDACAAGKPRGERLVDKVPQGK